jgi:hypothetical protein
MLSVRARKAHNLVCRPWYGGGLLKSSARLILTVGNQEKRSARVWGRNPLFSDTIEFILGE